MIAARADWSGHAAAVSPMDQLTVMRRGKPERTLKQETPGGAAPPPWSPPWPSRSPPWPLPRSW
ncbi:hypothetical protein NKH77_50485 [Streptomyces sp. M19]